MAKDDFKTNPLENFTVLSSYYYIFASSLSFHLGFMSLGWGQWNLFGLISSEKIKLFTGQVCREGCVGNGEVNIYLVQILII